VPCIGFSLNLRQHAVQRFPIRRGTFRTPGHSFSRFERSLTELAFPPFFAPFLSRVCSPAAEFPFSAAFGAPPPGRSLSPSFGDVVVISLLPSSASSPFLVTGCKLHPSVECALRLFLLDLVPFFFFFWFWYRRAAAGRFIVPRCFPSLTDTCQVKPIFFCPPPVYLGLGPFERCVLSLAQDLLPPVKRRLFPRVAFSFIWSFGAGFAFVFDILRPPPFFPFFPPFRPVGQILTRSPLFSFCGAFYVPPTIG